MAWTTPRTWVAGEIVTAAIGNTHWRDNENYLYAVISEVSPSAATVTFSSIPQTYKHLIIYWQAYCVAEQTIKLQFNGDSTAANYRYSIRELLNGAANDGRVAAAGGISMGVAGDATGTGEGMFVIPGYSNAFTVRAHGTYGLVDSVNDRVGVTAGAWTSGGPVTSISIPFTIAGGVFTLIGVP